MSGKQTTLIPSGRGRNRYYYLAGLLFCATLIGLSVWLTPAEKGFGTHKQLGLPECSFQQTTGVPGPSCGMTTSFAHMSSGNLFQAIRANLFGVLIYGVILISGIEALMQLLSVNISPVTVLANHLKARHLFVVMTLWLLSWMLKLYVFAGLL